MTTERERFDVVVVGAGPAGSTAATLIADRGHRVLIVERETMPCYKIGESLLPSTIHGVCELLGVGEEIRKAGFVRKMGGTFIWGKSANPWTFAFADSSRFPGPTSFAYQVERARFDAILLENARRHGVEVREKTSVTDLILDGARAVGVRGVDSHGAPYEIDCEYVVDASGHGSSICKYAGERIYSEFFKNIAVFGYFENAARLPEPYAGNILCCAFPKGWIWYIPLSETLTSVGVVIGQENASVVSHGREAAYLALLEECEPVRRMLTDAERVAEGPYGEVRVRRDFSYCSTGFWRSGFGVVGDAACFIDPVFSSGVHLATYSALLLARSINTCLSGSMPEERALREFERRYLREYRVFYDFLLAFYDVDQDLDTYYWNARKVLNTEESANEAFIRLVGGASQSDEPLFASGQEFLRARRGMGAALFPAASGETQDMYRESVPNSAERKRFMAELIREGSQMQARAVIGRMPCQPIFEDGLVPSEDGLHWAEPNSADPSARPIRRSV